MFNNPIYESAFKELDTLYEQDFNLAQTSEEEITDFLDSDEENKDIDVIDLDAESEEDLDESNIGKILLQCPCCETIICKKAEEIELPEDSEDADEDLFVSIGEACPVCFSEEGYKIIGKVAPYEETEIDIESTDDDDTDDVDDTDIDTDDEEDIDPFEPEESESADATSDEDEDEDKKEKDENLDESLITPDLKKPVFEKKIEEAKQCELCADTVPEQIDEKLEEAACTEDASLSDESADSIKNIVASDLKEEILTESEVDIPAVIPDNAVLNDLVDTPAEISEDLNEGLNDVQLDTDHEHISIHTEVKADNGEEMIAPLDFQSANEIVDAQPEEPEAADFLDDVEVEDQAEDAPTEEVAPADEIEADISDFDEKSFDDLGESYFKQVYDNVTSYITESVQEKGNNLIVEGIITFSTGKQGKTQFILEGNKLDAAGNCSILVENMLITPGKKSFTLNGKLKDGNFISESLDYNYSDDNSELKGTVTTNK